MNTKLTVGALAGALLMSGLLVGVSDADSGGDAGTVEAEGSAGGTGTVIELWWDTRGKFGSLIGFFPMDTNAGRCDDSDPRCLQVTLKEMPIFDQDGTRVGRQHIQCTWGPHLKPEKSIDWFCSYVTQLKDGPYTDLGQLTGVGIKRPNGDVLVSITGGTGAYENAGGYAFQTGDTGRVPFTIHLSP